MPKLVFVVRAVGVIGIVCASLLVAHRAADATSPGPSPPEVRHEIEYLKAVNAAGPPRDPQLVFLLMTQLANANREVDGIAFFSARLAEFDARLVDAQRAIYKAAIASLRARHTPAVAAGQRAAWAAETDRLFGEARQLSGGQIYAIRWFAAIGLSKDEEALGELTWCVENVAKAPAPSWLRLVYLRLAAIERKRGHADKALELVRLSGSAELEPKIALNTPYATDPSTGLAVGPKRIVDVVPGKVFTASGFDFGDLHFVVSEDHRQLMAIDAGTTPEGVKAGYEALRAHAPDLPPLGTVFITHAHADHIGGHRFYRELGSHPRFYGRENYAVTVTRQFESPSLQLLRSQPPPPVLDEVRRYAPDVPIDTRTDLNIGGTRVELIPVRGGDTVDAMFISMPDLGVLFVGDFATPFIGSVVRDEGNLDELFAAIDEAAKRNPKIVLHGHDGLTRVMPSVALLTRFKAPLAWLRDQTIAGVAKGLERGQLQQANLIPPGLLAEPDLQLPYLLYRENVINRIYKQ